MTFLPAPGRKARFHRIATSIVAVGLLAASCARSSASAADTTQFTDTVCEKATPIGRHLNDLVEKNATLTPELMSAALAMRDVYAECASGYDRDATSNTGHGGEQYGSSNGATIGRLYSRLALARALQRVAQYDAYDKRPDDAAAALADANRRLDEMERVQGLGDAHPGSPERTLLLRAQDVRASIAAAMTALKSAPQAMTVPTAAPSASATAAAPKK